MQNKFLIPGDHLKVPEEILVHCIIYCIQSLCICIECLLSQPKLGLTVFEQVVSVEWGRSWTGEIPCVVTARASSLWSVITWGCQHRAQIRLHETPPQQQWCSVCTAQGTGSQRQRISHGISRIILRCWLRDCFCVTWESQLTAGEGSYLWAVRIQGQPCLIFLPSHLDWGFLLQLSSTSFYSQWYTGSCCSSFHHPPFAMLAESPHSAPSWAVQVSARAVCAVQGEARHSWRCLHVLCVGRACAVGVGSSSPHLLRHVKHSEMWLCRAQADNFCTLLPLLQSCWLCHLQALPHHLLCLEFQPPIF